ncbi:MAG: glycosyltransferase family 2 protein, partial [Mycobacteriales bacterium]
MRAPSAAEPLPDVPREGGLPGAAAADCGPPLGVVTVTYSPGESLPTFMSTLATATTCRYAVTLADNGSTDGEPEKAARADGVTLLRTGANIGFGAAANVGVAQTASDWVVVANPDVEWRPGSIDGLLAAAARWPKAGAIGPAIITANGDLYPSARAIPSLGRGIAHALLGWWWPSNPWTRSYRREQGSPAEGPVGWLSGSCLLLRRDAFCSVEGFDPSYFMYFEDLDLCERLGSAGWTCVYVPSVVVGHTGGHATRKAPAAMVLEHHRSAYRYLSRRYAGAGYLPLRLAIRVGLAVRARLSRVVHGIGEGA